MRKLTVTIDAQGEDSSIIIEADQPGSDEVENKLTNVLGHAFTHIVDTILGSASKGVGLGSNLEEAKLSALVDCARRSSGGNIPTQ